MQTEFVITTFTTSKDLQNKTFTRVWKIPAIKIIKCYENIQNETHAKMEKSYLLMDWKLGSIPEMHKYMVQHK